jgi:arylsulfatase A-like enzyme
MTGKGAHVAARPNIVLILGDEHHIRTVGCYGGKPVRTPNIDRIAREGMQFNEAFCCASICSPSRAALFTGLLPHRFGRVTNDLAIPAGTPNLAGLLSARGYRLGYAGKWHVDHATIPTAHGFDGKDHPGYGFPVFLFKGDVDPAAMQRKRNPYYEYLVENGFDVPTLRHKHAAPEFESEGDTRIIDALQTGPKEASIPWYVGSESVDIVGRMARTGRAGRTISPGTWGTAP